MNFRVVSGPEYFDKNWNILQHAIREIFKCYDNARHHSFEELHRFFLMIPIVASLRTLSSFDHNVFVFKLCISSSCRWILFRVFEMIKLEPNKTNFQKCLKYLVEIYQAHARKQNTQTLNNMRK